MGRVSISFFGVAAGRGFDGVQFSDFTACNWREMWYNMYSIERPLQRLRSRVSRRYQRQRALAQPRRAHECHVLCRSILPPARFFGFPGDGKGRCVSSGKRGS